MSGPIGFVKLCLTLFYTLGLLYWVGLGKNKNKNKNKFISEQKMKFDDNEILLINILLETHTMGTTAIT